MAAGFSAVSVFECVNNTVFMSVIQQIKWSVKVFAVPFCRDRPSRGLSSGAGLRASPGCGSKVSYQNIGEHGASETDDRTDHDSSQKPLPKAVMYFIEHALTIEVDPETAKPQKMTCLHTEKRHEREYADIAGGDPGQLVQMKLMININDGNDAERDDRERPQEDADPACGGKLRC